MILKDVIMYLFIDKDCVKDYKCRILVEKYTDEGRVECVDEFHISDENKLGKYANATLVDIFTPNDIDENMVVHVTIN